MCLICDRIEMIKQGTNPYFVKEMETGYVVIGDNQHFKGYTLFLCKKHETELFHLDKAFAVKFMSEMVTVAEAVKKAFHAEKMNYECLGNGDTHLHWHLFPRVAEISKTMATMAGVLSGGILWRKCTMTATGQQRKNWKH